jgi:hypothetical protein
MKKAICQDLTEIWQLSFSAILKKLFHQAFGGNNNFEVFLLIRPLVLQTVSTAQLNIRIFPIGLN